MMNIEAGYQTTSINKNKKLTPTLFNTKQTINKAKNKKNTIIANRYMATLIHVIFLIINTPNKKRKERLCVTNSP